MSYIVLLRLLHYLWSTWAILWFLLITSFIVIIVILAGFLKISQNTIHFIANIWAHLLIKGIGCKISINGLENLEKEKTYIFACNHASSLDILVLLAALPKKFRWIAKKELFKIPIFGLSLKAAGYIAINRNNSKTAMHSITEASKYIKKGISIVIFPEGTRSKDGNLLPFKTGGFILSKRSSCPIVPVAIIGSHRALGARRLLLIPGIIQVKIGIPLTSQKIKDLDCSKLAKLTYNRVLELLN